MNIYEIAPGRGLIAVTKSDTTVLEDVRALWVGTGGDLSVITPGSATAVTLKNVPDGTLIPVKVAKVMAATTASNIVGIL